MSSVNAFRLLIAHTVVCLIAILVPIEIRAGNLAFDHSGNLFFEARNTGGDAVTDPKGISRRRWSVHLKAVWNIPEAKFTSKKVTNE